MINKEIGYIGLGKMGKGMVARLLETGWSVVAYNRSPESVEEMVKIGAKGANTLPEVISVLSAPRVLWLMVPHTNVDAVLSELVPLLEKGDLVIDGGNSPYLETIRRGKELEEKGIKFMDIGVSGGPGGARSGACMMAGGPKELYEMLGNSGFFKDTCLPSGYGHMGPTGAGHYVKMVHNGIEYGMMQSISEGFDLMRHSRDFDLDLGKITEVYSHGSVITSSLVSWMNDAYKKYGKDLNDISGRASASGEGKWTVEAGARENIPMPAIEASIAVRTASQTKPSYQGKVVSAMRGEFGQHPVKRATDEPEII